MNAPVLVRAGRSLALGLVAALGWCRSPAPAGAMTIERVKSPGGIEAWVVRDAAVHARICDDVSAWLGSRGWTVFGVTQSPITGPEGNVEFLIAAGKGTAAAKP